MKKTIILGLVIGLGISYGIVEASNLIIGQYSTLPVQTTISVPQSLLQSNIVSNSSNQIKVISNEIINVPKGIYVAHINTDKGVIDVQKFTDTSNSVICYYSVVSFNNQVLANCIK